MQSALRGSGTEPLQAVGQIGDQIVGILESHVQAQAGAAGDQCVALRMRSG